VAFSRTLSRLARWLLAAIIAFYALIVLGLLALRVVNPLTTAVQMERHFDALIHHRAYSKVYTWQPLAQISPALQHAVVAAEDASFYRHHGFDWKQVRIAVQDDIERGKSRGASTITQQLGRNLFLSTNRSWIRKGIEFTIVPLLELILGKRRILELYLNVIEWGPGVYGAEAAAQRYFHTPAQRLTREQALGLASVLPAPLRRKPGRLPDYEHIIADRMSQAGW
jgi:monofunctional biosynthetic peptidoglycan transglycosylase